MSPENTQRFWQDGMDKEKGVQDSAGLVTSGDPMAESEVEGLRPSRPIIADLLHEIEIPDHPSIHDVLDMMPAVHG